MSDVEYEDDDPAEEEELPPELAMVDTEALEAELDEAGAEEGEEGQKAEEEEEVRIRAIRHNCDGWLRYFTRFEYLHTDPTSWNIEFECWIWIC